MHNSIYIFGLGMMGGSLAKAIKHKKLSKKIYGYDVNKKSLLYAKKSKIINDYDDGNFNYLSSADLIIICAPISAYKMILKTINNYKKSNAVITDIGSARVNIESLVKKILNNHADNFIGSHPLTGKETSSIKSSDRNIFNQELVLVTPSKLSKKILITKISRFWKSLGCNIYIINAKTHDVILSQTSHLPHLVSFALVNIILSKKSINIKDYTGGGFKDFARLAHSDPLMWKDICANNNINIVSSIDMLIKELTTIKSKIKNNKYNSLYTYFKNIKIKLDKK